MSSIQDLSDSTTTDKVSLVVTNQILTVHRTRLFILHSLPDDPTSTPQDPFQKNQNTSYVVFSGREKTENCNGTTYNIDLHQVK